MQNALLPDTPVGLAAVAASFDSHPGQALAQIERIVARARRRGARLVVLPEYSLGGYPDAEGGPSVGGGLRLDGDEIRRLARIAGDAVVCAGFVEAAAGGPYSSAVCVTGDGVLGHHRKVHIPPSEVSVFTAGSTFSAFDTPLGRIGMMICYDKVFPEAARSLALDGAELIASLSAWPACRFAPAARVSADRQTRQFNLLDQARAVENQVVWVAANLTGRRGALRFVGQAKVVGPDGDVLARTGARAGMAQAEVAVGASVRSERAAYAHLEKRAPAAYRGAGSGCSQIAPAGLEGIATQRPVPLSEETIDEIVADALGDVPVVAADRGDEPELTAAG